MAEEAQEPEAGASGGKKGGMLVMIIIVLLAIGGGIMTPFVVAKITTPSEKKGTEEKMDEPDPQEEVEFIPFDEVTVNLEAERFARYLRLNFSLQVAKSQRAEIEAQVKAKSVIFKNWIQVHIAEKSMDDLKGISGRNRVRRELQDFFNEVLFDDGIERIQDVLFNEFHVQ